MSRKNNSQAYVERKQTDNTVSLFCESKEPTEITYNEFKAALRAALLCAATTIYRQTAIV